MYIKNRIASHQTYETLFCILLKLEYLACNFIPNALHTQFMKRCFGFCFNWSVFYVILR